MLGKLLAAFILIPLVEFFLLVWIAERTSVLTTIGLVIITGIIGSLLARAEGVKAWRRFRESAAEGRLPGREIQDGLMIAFAAALLLTPGLLTDAVGFFLLIPFTRERIRRFMASRVSNGVHFQVFSQTRRADGTVEAESWSNPAEQTAGWVGENDYGPIEPDKLHRPNKEKLTIDAAGVRTIDS